MNTESNQKKYVHSNQEVKKISFNLSGAQNSIHPKKIQRDHKVCWILKLIPVRRHKPESPWAEQRESDS